MRSIETHFLSYKPSFRIRNAAEAQCPGRVFFILEMAPQEDTATTPATEAPHARMAATRKVLSPCSLCPR